MRPTGAAGGLHHVPSGARGGPSARQRQRQRDFCCGFVVALVAVTLITYASVIVAPTMHSIATPVTVSPALINVNMRSARPQTLEHPPEPSSRPTEGENASTATTTAEPSSVAPKPAAQQLAGGLDNVRHVAAARAALQNHFRSVVEKHSHFEHFRSGQLRPAQSSAGTEGGSADGGGSSNNKATSAVATPDDEWPTETPAPPTAPPLPDVLLSSERIAQGPVRLTLACHARAAVRLPAANSYVDPMSGRIVIPTAPVVPLPIASITTPMYTTVGALGNATTAPWVVPTDEACEAKIAAVSDDSGPAFAGLAGMHPYKGVPAVPYGDAAVAAAAAAESSDAALERPAVIVPFEFQQGTYSRPVRRPVLRKAHTAAAVAACFDERFPARLPLMVVPFGAVYRTDTPATAGDEVSNNTKPRVGGTTLAPVVLPCYGTGDVVCDSLRTGGVWETDILGQVHEALQGVVQERYRRLRTYFNALASKTGKTQSGGAKAAIQAALAAVDADLRQQAGRHEGLRTARWSSFGVEYLDIGANVGAFVMHFWRLGYPVTAFEALPFNMQLLSTSLCLNGLQRPRGGGNESAKATSSPSAAATVRSADGSVVIIHTALSRERDLRCVMLSEDENFGDTWISCNRTHVASTSEYPFERYRRRGFVTMTTLDSFYLGPTAVVRHDATVRRAAVRAGLAVLGYNHSDAAQMNALAELERTALTASERLPPDFFSKDYVAKIDVEGHEVQVMEGARELLANATLRPRAIVSEVWLSLNMTRFAEIMLPEGYVGWSVAFRIRMDRMALVRGYNRMRGGQDTVVWIERRWEGLLIPRIFQAATKDDDVMDMFPSSNKRSRL
jgi:hypothetical protein